MYQADQKEKYLEDKGYLTRVHFVSFFNKVKNVEQMKQKGVQGFTLEEVESLLTYVNPKNSKQAKVYCSIINGLRRFVRDDESNLFVNVDSDFYTKFD